MAIVKNGFFLFIPILFPVIVFSQQNIKKSDEKLKGLMQDSIFNPFKVVLDNGLITEDELNKLAPNRPKYFFLGNFKESNFQFYKKLQLWAEYHPEETEHLNYLKELIDEGLSLEINKFFSVIENEVTVNVMENKQSEKTVVSGDNASGTVPDFPDEYKSNILKVAIHIPNRPNRADRFSTEEESMQHRIAMNQWAKEYPEEFKRAVLLDSYLFVFKPDTSSDANKKDPWLYPEFMRYPVTRLKPEFFDSGNPERDKKHFENMTQYWYFLYDKEGYKQEYGSLPVIIAEEETLKKQ